MLLSHRVSAPLASLPMALEEPPAHAVHEFDLTNSLALQLMTVHALTVPKGPEPCASTAVEVAGAMPVPAMAILGADKQPEPGVMAASEAGTAVMSNVDADPTPSVDF